MGCGASSSGGDKKHLQLKKHKVAPVSHTDAAEDVPQSEEVNGMRKLPYAITTGGGDLGLLSGNEKSKIGEWILNKNELPMTDDNFPADNSVLFRETPRCQGIEWKRIRDLCETPRLIADGASYTDIVQGELGDCWFLSACTAVATNPDLLKKLFDQTEHGQYESSYMGIFTFKFWRFGEWIQVAIDDVIPTKNGGPAFARSGEKTEFWPTLLEKAYAKIHGSYEGIEGGQAADAFVDLTGGITEKYDLTKIDIQRLFMILRNAHGCGALMTCSKKPPPPKEQPKMGSAGVTDDRGVDSHGLVGGHAYTIISLDEVRTSDATSQRLVLVRNPWGDVEWNGIWSDSSSEWDKVSNGDRQRLQTVAATQAGQFWMPWSHFCLEFQSVTTLLMGADLDGDGSADIATYKQIRGEWMAGKNAGGSRNDILRFSSNPQYLLSILKPDTTPLSKDDKGKAQVLVTLMQDHRMSERNKVLRKKHIGICVYTMPKQKKAREPYRVSDEHFRYNHDIGSSSPYINSREVVLRLSLKPGQYVIVPSTFDPDESSKFIIRVYAQAPFKLSELFERKHEHKK